KLLLKSLQAGSAYHVFHTRLATVVKKYTDHEIQVSIGTAPPKSTLEVSMGRVDLAFSAPTIIGMMQKKIAMYSKLEKAPELAKNLRVITSHSGGWYQLAVYADSGIKTLKDIKGKTLWLAYKGGAASRVMVSIFEGVTGYKADRDFKVSPLAGQASVQAFQDGQLAMWALPTELPSQVIQQFALTRKIRLVGFSEADFSNPAMKRVLSFPGRRRITLPANLYGANQANTEPVKTIGTTGALLTSKFANEKAVYDITKALWTHIAEIHAAAKYMPNFINRKSMFNDMNVPLHVGAYRYYKEAGFKVPDSVIPPEAK
ncbi:MAG: TAXI family TRAP transporter solute-binding subunit, partial [Bauldia litoralis]